MRDLRSSRVSDDPPSVATGAVEALARRLPSDPPWVAVAAIFFGAYLVITPCLVVIGLLVASDRHGWDGVRANRWFVGQRTTMLNDVTALGSRLAETLTVIAIAVIVVAVLAFRRRFLAAGFIAMGLTLEVSVFLTTTLLVDRNRPSVPRLDAAPPTSSFPSGHTAAAIVLYGGVAIVLMTSMRHRSSRVLTAVVLFAVPVIVGLSRLYRGMHHPTDVFAGALLGLMCLAAAGLAIRVAAYDAARSRGREADTSLDARSAGSIGALR